MDSDDGAISNPMEADPGKMFIGGLHSQTSADVLQRYFEQYGEVKECVVMRDSVTKRSRGFGFVRFNDSTCVDKVANCCTHTIDGKKVDPKRAIPKRPPPGANQYKKVFVGGLPPDTTAADMKDYFETFGKVTEILLMHDRNTKRLRGFGFVTFESDLAGKNVCETGFHKLKGKSVECKRAQPKEVMMLQVNVPFPFARGYPNAFTSPMGFGFPAEWALNPQICQNIANMYSRYTPQGFVNMPDHRRPAAGGGAGGGSQYYAEYANAPAAPAAAAAATNGIVRREHSPNAASHSSAVVTTSDQHPSHSHSQDFDQQHYSTVQLTQYNTHTNLVPPHSPLAQTFSQTTTTGPDPLSYLSNSRQVAHDSGQHLTAASAYHGNHHHQPSHAAFAHGLPQVFR